MIAALWVPDFSLQAWVRLHADSSDFALGMVDSVEAKSTSRLLAVNVTAQSCGVKAGMTVAQARVRQEVIRIVSRCMQAETEGISDLRSVLWGHSPQVRVDEKDLGWAYIGASGLDRLFGGMDAWTQRLILELKRSGFSTQIGVAPGWQQARMIALYGGGVLQDAASVDALKPMPLWVLEPSIDLGEQFQRLGIQTVGQFLNIPGEDVLGHMGEEAFLKHQIAHGKEPGGPLSFERQEESFVRERHFEEPVADLSALGFALRPMLEEVMRRIGARGLHARSVVMLLSYDGQGSDERIVESGVPTRSPKVMFELCRLSLERNPPCDSVGMIKVAAQPCKVDAVQYDLFEVAHKPHEKMALTLARLEGIFGKERVGSPRFLESYREDVFEQGPFFPESSPGPQPVFGTAPVCLRRFRPPEPARVICRGGRLVHLGLQRFSGPIKEWHGPYRVYAEWWNESLRTSGRGFFQDLYDVRVKGMMYRLSWDHHTRTWLALGWYD